MKDRNTDESGALFPVPRRFSVPLSPSCRVALFRNGSRSSYQLDRRKDDPTVVIGLDQADRLRRPSVLPVSVRWNQYCSYAVTRVKVI